jgi:hypothetical protein
MGLTAHAKEGIRGGAMFVIFLSKNYFNDENAMNQLEYAIDLRKPVFVVYVTGSSDAVERLSAMFEEKGIKDVKWLEVPTMGTEESKRMITVALQRERWGFARITELEQEIKRAHDHIMGLKDNWDTEGAKPYTQEHWDQVEAFIRKLYGECLELRDIPSILPCDSDIDIHWRNDRYELLLGIDIKGEVGYYGDNYSKTIRVEGDSNQEGWWDQLLADFRKLIRGGGE